MDRESTVDPKMLRVLIVDDEDIAAEHARTVLGEVGIRADVCMSGDDALRMLEVQHLSKPVEPTLLYQTLGELIYEAEAEAEA